MSQALGERVIEVSTRVLGPDHPDTLARMHSLALTHRDLWMWDEAAEPQARIQRARCCDNPDPERSPYLGVGIAVAAVIFALLAENILSRIPP
jgi:Tetratricopeptide repeat